MREIDRIITQVSLEEYSSPVQIQQVFAHEGSPILCAAYTNKDTNPFEIVARLFDAEVQVVVFELYQ